MREPRRVRCRSIVRFCISVYNGRRTPPAQPSYERRRTGNALHKLLIAPTSLQDSAPIEYIEATVAAGYDGIGLRVHRSPGLPFHPVVGDAALIARDEEPDRGCRPSTVFDLYSFYLRAGHGRRELRARDGAWRLVRREIRDRDGRRHGLVAPARQFHRDLRSREAIRPHLLARIRRDPPARDPAADRAAHRRGEARRRDLHRPAASCALRRQRRPT